MTAAQRRAELLAKAAVHDDVARRCFREVDAEAHREAAAGFRAEAREIWTLGEFIGWMVAGTIFCAWIAFCMWVNYRFALVGHPSAHWFWCEVLRSCPK